MHHFKKYLQSNIPLIVVALAVVFTIAQTGNLVSMFGIQDAMADIIDSIQTPLARSNVQNSLPAISTDESDICSVSEEILHNGEDPIRIVIPVLDMNLAISNKNLENGIWTVDEKVANYATETSKVNNISGNVGLFGHDKMDALRPIKHLKTGDVIIIYTQNMTAYYTVTVDEITTPDNLSVFYQTDTPMLTLLTCDGKFSEQRYVIHANLERITAPSCARSK